MIYSSEIKNNLGCLMIKYFIPISILFIIFLIISGCSLFKTDNNYPLSHAVYDGDLEKVEKLVKKGADENADDRILALVYAAYEGRLDMVDVFVDKKRQVIVENESKSPIDLIYADTYAT